MDRGGSPAQVLHQPHDTCIPCVLVFVGIEILSKLLRNVNVEQTEWARAIIDTLESIKGEGLTFARISLELAVSPFEGLCGSSFDIALACDQSLGRNFAVSAASITIGDIITARTKKSLSLSSTAKIPNITY